MEMYFDISEKCSHWKHEKYSICSWEANAPFTITIYIYFFLIRSHLWNDVMDLYIAYEVIFSLLWCHFWKIFLPQKRALILLLWTNFMLNFVSYFQEHSDYFFFILKFLWKWCGWKTKSMMYSSELRPVPPNLPSVLCLCKVFCIWNLIIKVFMLIRQ